jgi:hypothetical protein
MWFVGMFVNERKTHYKREGFWAMIPRRSEAWSAYQLLRQVAARFAREFAKLSLAQLQAARGLLDWSC